MIRLCRSSRAALVMLFIGGIATYTFVWDLGDVGVGLMTVFNIAFLYPLAGQALGALKEYEGSKRQNTTPALPI